MLSMLFTRALLDGSYGVARVVLQSYYVIPAGCRWAAAKEDQVVASLLIGCYHIPRVDKATVGGAMQF